MSGSFENVCLCVRAIGGRSPLLQGQRQASRGSKSWFRRSSVTRFGCGNASGGMKNRGTGAPPTGAMPDVLGIEVGVAAIVDDAVLAREGSPLVRRIGRRSPLLQGQCQTCRGSRSGWRRSWVTRFWRGKASYWNQGSGDGAPSYRVRCGAGRRAIGIRDRGTEPPPKGSGAARDGELLVSGIGGRSPLYRVSDLDADVMIIHRVRDFQGEATARRSWPCRRAGCCPPT